MKVLRKFHRFLVLATIILALAAVVSFYKVFQRSKIKVQSYLEIADNEYYDLDFFLQKLIYKEGFGYTLFGDKPISITGFFDPEPIENLLVGRNDQILKRGWAIWKKHHFNIGNYLLFEEKSDLEDNLTIITLVNKDAFLKTFNEHIDTFRQILGETITGESLLEELNKKGANLFNLLKRSEGLYGILLGYGKINSFLFQRRQELNLTPTPAPIVLSKLIPFQGFTSLKEEIEFIKREFHPIIDDSVLCRFFLPEFIGLPHDTETVELLQKYRKVRHQIMKRYAKGNFLEITLRALTEAE